MLRLRAEMSAWIKQSLPLQRRIPWTGGHDEGTFLSAWFGYYVLTGEERTAEFLRWMRDGWLAWADKNLVHGYYPRGEVHHQPETFLIFLTRMLHLDPKHEPTLRAMDHLAHHVGNWVEGVPEWYDWQRRRFRSYWLGVEVVREEPPYDCEIADHIRLAEILLATYLANGDKRYLDFCRQYADKWCDEILAKGGRVPGVLFPTQDAKKIMAEYVRPSGQPPVPGAARAWDGNPSAGVEMHVAACSMDFLMDMFLLTEQERYIAAVKKMMPHVIEAIADPYSEPPGSLYSRYRKITGDTFLDERAMELRGAMPEVESPRSQLMIADTMDLPHPMGIGRRRDDLRWGYRKADGTMVEETGPSAGSLFLAWQITGEEEYLARALGRAADRIALARRHLVDGRHHGCAGATISAVASGHGRCPGIGCVTATLYPAALGAFRFCNAESPEVRYFCNGKLGLPEGVAAARLPGDLRLALCNTGEAPVEVEICLEPDSPGLHGLARPADGVRVLAKIPAAQTTVWRIEG